MSAFSVNADVFSVTGKVQRTLSDTNYGGCMLYMTSPLEHGCSSNWVSFDCNEQYYQGGLGSRNYATAMVAASLGKQVTVFFDNTKKYGNFCVGKRIDVLF